MSQAGNYPGNLAISRDPYGAVQHRKHHPPPCKECERRKANRGQCCGCIASFVATILTVVTLAYLILEALSLMDPTNVLIPWGRAFDREDTENFVPVEDRYLFYDCPNGREKYYKMILGLLGICILAYFAATIGFMASALFGDATPEEQLVWCKVFMWNSFCYPLLTRILLILDILVIHADCSKSVSSRERFNNVSFYAGTLCIVNGFVAIVFMIMAQRQIMVSPQVSESELGGGPAKWRSPEETDDAMENGRP